MSFIWPPLLLLLLAIPVGVAIYRQREARRAARAAAFGWGSGSGAAPAQTAAAAPGVRPARRRGPWLRRLPAILTVAGMTVLVFSLARPQSVIGVPRLEGTVLLAFDVSGSMAATDVAPSRMEAAKAAALQFVQNAPSSLRIGVVAFSDAGFSTQVPTDERSLVVAAIQRLEPERGTSLGRGIDASLTAIDLAEHPPGIDYYTNASPPPTPEPTPVPSGVHEPAVIVLFSDGENTVNPTPDAAIKAARDRGIRVDTIGIGTAAGATLEIDGFRIHSSLDEAILQDIASLTDGTYYAATDRADLGKIGDDVDRRFVVRSEPFELTSVFALGGFTLLAVGGLVSLRSFGRMP